MSFADCKGCASGCVGCIHLLNSEYDNGHPTVMMTPDRFLNLSETRRKLEMQYDMQTVCHLAPSGVLTHSEVEQRDRWLASRAGHGDPTRQLHTLKEMSQICVLPPWLARIARKEAQWADNHGQLQPMLDHIDFITQRCNLEPHPIHPNAIPPPVIPVPVAVVSAAPQPESEALPLMTAQTSVSLSLSGSTQRQLLIDDWTKTLDAGTYTGRDRNTQFQQTCIGSMRHDKQAQMPTHTPDQLPVHKPVLAQRVTKRKWIPLPQIAPVATINRAVRSRCGSRSLLCVDEEAGDALAYVEAFHSARGAPIRA